MVVLNKIYTKTGDDGTTALGDGTRVSKSSGLVSAYGSVDELNAILGIARLHAVDPISRQLLRIQNELFDLGADLCTPFVAEKNPSDSESSSLALRIIPSQITQLEEEIDLMNANLPALRSFILPGGNPLNAHLHHARTVARRVEREMLKVENPINPEALKYINRLSDWFFVAARVSTAKAGDILWQPGASREKNR